MKTGGKKLVAEDNDGTGHLSPDHLKRILRDLNSKEGSSKIATRVPPELGGP